MAKTMAGADADPALRRGLKWLHEAVESDFAKLGPRVQAEAARQAEEEACKVAERKARVEAQRAERKRLQEVRESERELTHVFPQVFVWVAGLTGLSISGSGANSMGCVLQPALLEAREDPNAGSDFHQIPK